MLPPRIARPGDTNRPRPLETAPKSPTASLRSFRVNPGFRVELMAAEPLVMDPISFDWGPDGKLWVAEMAGYPLGIDGQPGGRVRYLEDTDDDGRYDRSTLFLSGVKFPTGILAWREGVLVSAAPDIFYAEDTDGDGKADRRKILYTGFGEGNQQHRVNGFWRGLDNWVYVANGDSGGTIRSIKTGQTVNISRRDLRIRPDTGELEAVSGQCQYGRARNDWGSWFGCNNSMPLWHFLVEDRYFLRNPHVAAPSPRHGICTVGNTPIYPISLVLSHWSGYRPPAAGEPSRFTSANGITIYRDDLLEPAFKNNAFISEPVHNLVHRQVLRPSGITFNGGRAADEQQREFLASSDSWFRPTTIRTGPDGALWIADMYRLVIEHPEWIDDEEEKRLDLRAGHDMGRIYRVVPVGRSPRSIPRLDRFDTLALVAALDSASGWQRDLAQQMLIWCDDETAVAPLKKMAAGAERPLARLHALCTLDGLDALDAKVLAQALRDRHAGVRRHAIRLAETRLNDAPQLGEQLLRLVDDGDPKVQLQLAYSLGMWDDARAGEALGRLAVKHQGNVYLTAAVMSSANAGNVAELLAAVLAARAEDGPPEKLVRRVSSLAAAVGKERDLARTLQLISTPRDGRYARWQVAALASMIEALERRKIAPASLLDEEGRKRLKAVFAQARTTLGNGEAAEDGRIAALELLARNADRRSDDLERIAAVLTPRHSPRLQAAAVEALGALKTPRVADLLLSSWAGYSPPLRKQVLDVLLSRPTWCEALLAKLAENVVQPAHLDSAERQRLINHPKKRIAKQAAKLFAGASNISRHEVLEQHRDVLKLTGDPKRGRVVFRQKCGSCHRLEGVGDVVGPDLSALTNKSPEALWIAILDPNRAVEEKFVDYAAISIDGRTFTGMLAAETVTSITLRGQEGKEQVILRSELELLRGTGRSLMPEGFEKELSERDLADVIAYLANANSPPPNGAATSGRETEIGKIHDPSLVFESHWQLTPSGATFSVRTATELTTNRATVSCLPGEAAFSQ